MRMVYAGRYYKLLKQHWPRMPEKDRMRMRRENETEEQTAKRLRRRREISLRERK